LNFIFCHTYISQAVYCHEGTQMLMHQPVQSHSSFDTFMYVLKQDLGYPLDSPLKIKKKKKISWGTYDFVKLYL